MTTATLPDKPITEEGALALQCALWRDPDGWLYETFGVELWDRQIECLHGFRDHPKMAVRSGHAIGKSFFAASAAMIFIMAHSPSYVIVTAPTAKAARYVFWPEFRSLIARARYPIGGKLLEASYTLGDKWGIFTVTTDQPENFAGFRTPNGVLVIVDEASSLQPKIMEAITGLTASGRSRILLLGNPLRKDGPFYDAFRSPGWHGMRISSLDVPNVRCKREIIPGLATAQWVEECREEWGADSDFYRTRVLGEFPTAETGVIIPLEWVEAARDRTMPETHPDRLVMGVDIARYGTDQSVVIVRDDVAVRDMTAWSKASLMETAGRIIALAKQYAIPPARIRLDDCGVGGGVTDRLKEQGYGVQPVNNGAKAKSADRFANVRAETYWRMREAMNPEHPGALTLPRDKRYDALAAELTSPGYSYTSKGQIQVESKDAIRARLHRSPDHADALALTFAEAEREPRLILL